MGTRGLASLYACSGMAQARPLPSALFYQLLDQRAALCSSRILRKLNQGSPPPTRNP